MPTNTNPAQSGFGWSREEQIKKLATARPQILRVRPVDSVGENGITANQIRAELDEFAQRLHEWPLSPEAQAACQAEWDSYWRSQDAH